MNRFDAGAMRTPTGWEVVVESIEYCPDTGGFTWKERPRNRFPSERIWRSTNARFAGKPAGTVNTIGYVVFRVNYRDYLAHRVAWFLTHGCEPEFIDHINGNRSDNRLINLRDVSREQNQRNMAMPKNNTSGFVGVTFDAENGKWVAQIHIAGKRKFLGRYYSIDEAVAARQGANIRFGFHRNHGRAAK